MSSMQSLELGRFDITTAGVLNRDTVLPLDSAVKNKRQKFVIGDSTGVVSCYVMKKFTLEEQWKSPTLKKPITAMTIGGSGDVKDRIYSAHGQVVQGLKKKGGKPFFKFNTSLNEEIENIRVHDVKCWITCGHLYSMFVNCQDTQFYMASDKINQLLLIPDLGIDSIDPLALLGCQDAYVRAVQGSSLTKEVRVEGAVTSLLNYIGTNDGGKSTDVLYGTERGTGGVLSVMNNGSDIRQRAAFANDLNKRGVSSMCQIAFADDGAVNVVVGRDDGLLEVYASGRDSVLDDEPLYSHEFQESIVSLHAAKIISTVSDDLLLSTYGGKVTALTTEMQSNLGHIKPNMAQSLAADKKNNSADSGMSMFGKSSSKRSKDEEQKEEEQKMQELTKEVEAVKKSIAAVRESCSVLNGSSKHMALDTQFKIKSGFKLLAEEALYLISIEIGTPMDIVILQSDVMLQVHDVASNNAMVSTSQIEKDPAVNDTSAVLMTFRCQDNVSRIDVKIRTIEGHNGNINLYVIPKQLPKTSQRAVLQVKPLSLHERVDVTVAEAATKQRPMNVLTLSGDFSLNEVHSWVVSCLPGLSSKLNTDNVKYAFKSSFVHSYLFCEYNKGKGVFTSESVSAISILKEIITKEATLKKVRINVSLDLKNDASLCCVGLLQAQLEHNFTLAKQHAMIDSLKDIETHEGENSFLSDEFKYIIDNSEKIAAEFKQAGAQLEFLKDVVTDLYVDFHKLRGKRTTKQQELLALLTPATFSFQSLLDIFSPDK